MSRLKEANRASRETIWRMSQDRAQRALVAIHDALWPEDDPAKEWSPTTIENVADAVAIAVAQQQGEED